MIYSNGDNYSHLKDKLQSDTTTIEKWFLSNNVNVNVNKSGCMLIISSSQRLRLTPDLDVTMYMYGSPLPKLTPPPPLAQHGGPH